MSLHVGNGLAQRAIGFDQAIGNLRVEPTLKCARERVGEPREATGRAESKWAGPDGVVIDISEPGWAV